MDPDVRRGFQQAARRKAASRKARKALYAASIVESGGRNLSYGDRDSVGPLQQRPSQGWRHARDPEKAAGDFLDRAEAYIKAHPRAKSGEVAQGVQRSAFPGRYSAHDVQRQAERLVRGGPSTPGPPGPQNGRIVPGRMVPGKMSFKGGFTPTQETPSFRVAATMALSHGSKSGLPKLGHSRLAQASALFRSGLATETTGGEYVSETATSPSRAGHTRVVPAGTREQLAGSSRGKVKIVGANPERLKSDVLRLARRTAALAGEELTADSGATHSKYTVDGNVSQHWDGTATDILAAGKRLLRLGRAALIAAGMPRAKAMKQTGGLYNVNGHQVIFLTNQGGNHYDHLHLGA